MGKAKSKTRGRKSSEKVATSLAKPPSDVANANAEVAVESTSPRKQGQKGKKKHRFSILPASKTKKAEGNPFLNKILSRTMGPGGIFIGAYIEQVRNLCGGYIGACYLEVKENQKGALGNLFDCRLSDPQYIRASHETNEKLDVGYVSKQSNTKYNRCGLIGSPPRKPMEEDEEREKKFRDEVERVMLAHPNKSARVTKYEKWDYKKHSLTKQDYEPLDMFFTDETVADVIRVYMLPEEVEEKDAYEYLKERKMGKLFSRKKNRRYCSLAIEAFNFPDDEAAQSDYGEEAGDEDEDENDDGNTVTGEEDNVEAGEE